MQSSSSFWKLLFGCLLRFHAFPTLANSCSQHIPHLFFPLQNLAMRPNSWQLKHVIGFPPITINQKQTFIVSVSFFSTTFVILLAFWFLYFSLSHISSVMLTLKVTPVISPNLPFTPFLPYFIFQFSPSRAIILTKIYTIAVRLSPFSFWSQVQIWKSMLLIVYPPSVPLRLAFLFFFGFNGSLHQYCCITAPFCSSVSFNPPSHPFIIDCCQFLSEEPNCARNV